MSVDDDDHRDVLAALSFYTGRTLSGELKTCVSCHWPYGGQTLRTVSGHCLAALRRLGRSLRERADDHGITLLIRDDPAWPSILDIDSPCLWVSGNVDVMTRLGRAVTITGARACTETGRHVAAELASSLAAAGLTLVTGLSFGIDAAAAAAGFDTENPPIVVAPAGLDHPSRPPLCHLAEQATLRSALISPFPPGCAPSNGRWNYRDALLGQLGAATVLVEVPRASRAMLTAAAAPDRRRLVCAIPGPGTAETWAGGRRLITERAAQPVMHGGDVLSALRNIARRGNLAAAQAIAHIEESAW